MVVKKARELRFAYEDKDGALRAVVIHVQHVREKGDDRVDVQVVSDHAPVEVRTLVKPALKKAPRARS